MSDALWCAVQVAAVTAVVLSVGSVLVLLCRRRIARWLMGAELTTADLVDDAYEHAAAILTPDALPPAWRIQLDDDQVADLFADLVFDYHLDSLADPWDVDRAITKLLPPVPPVIPGRPESDA